MKRRKYDTREKRIRFLKKKGKIVTFKERFDFKGDLHWQILIEKLDVDRKTGRVRIDGFGKLSPWYNSLDELIEAVDWETMEEWHSF